MPFTEYPPDTNLRALAVYDPTTEKEGQTGVWKSAIWDKCELTSPDKPETLFELFEQSVARHPDWNMCLRRSVVATDAASNQPIYGNELIGTTYATMQARRTALGSALLALERAGRLRSPAAIGSGPSPPEITFPGIPYYGNHNRVKNGARRGWGVGMWTQNRAEWQIVDLACQAYGLVSASLYETLGPDNAKHITNHCPLSIIFSSSSHISSLLRLVPRCPTLKIIVCVDPLPRRERDVLSQWATSLDIELLDMLELEKWGAEEGVRCDPGPVKGIAGEKELDKHRIVSIAYTSGTTGDPKGVILTNYNLTTAVISNCFGVSLEHHAVGEWRFLSYLPLSHMFESLFCSPIRHADVLLRARSYEHFLELLVVHGDGAIAYTSGDTTKLLEEAQIFQPHFMAGVPRVYNRIHAAVQAQMNSPGLKGALLKRAVNTKIAKWRNTGEVKHTLYDALVFRKIRNLLGGNLVTITSGAAPISPDVLEMLKVCFSCDAVNGYGMTESMGTCTKGPPFDVGSTSNVGAIQPCNEIKLMDVADMGYTSKDLPNPRGEICLRGSNISKGYLHDLVGTAKSIDANGWMHTGDVGELDAQGHLKIVDRIKNVIKLSQGEYVALEKLEGTYLLNPLFAALVLHGDSSQSYLVALALLDPIMAASLVSKVLGQTLAPSDVIHLEEAVQDRRIRQSVVQAMAETARDHKMNGFEMVKRVYLTITPFPAEMVTPTLKYKRHIAARIFRQEIDEMYHQGNIGKGEEAVIAKL